MTEPTSAVPATAPAPLLNNYRIVGVNGLSVYVASPNDLQTFCKIAKCDGYVASDKLFINYNAIVSIEYVGPFQPAEVAQFGPRPVN